MKDKTTLFEADDNLLEFLKQDSQRGGDTPINDMLWDMCRLKYFRQEHIKYISPEYSRYCSTEKLAGLVKIGFLKQFGDVYHYTNKTREYLHSKKYQTFLLQKTDPDGKGLKNEINNTEVIKDLFYHPQFHALFYPTFPPEGAPYIKPDALVILNNREKRLYKLCFLEIEAHKEGWIDYLDEKKNRYLRLANDEAVYNFWKHYAPKVGFPKPNIDTFSFSVVFICSIKRDWGEGFRFISSIEEL
ncbi:MAG: hypothetical protein NT007_07985 [Candidatus Kapabacteria bacterium]|nr:hypothetical protein [Candidatus Kapabacteria bacterium]